MVVLGYVFGGADYNSVKLLKLKEVDLIADGPGLQLLYYGGKEMPYYISNYAVEVAITVLYGIT
jgi:hypothetical protein